MREPRTVSGERPGRRWRAGLGCAGLGWAALPRGASSRGAEERRDPGRQGAPRPASRRGSPWPFAQTLRSSPPPAAAGGGSFLRGGQRAARHGSPAGCGRVGAALLKGAPLAPWHWARGTGGLLWAAAGAAAGRGVSSGGSRPFTPPPGESGQGLPEPASGESYHSAFQLDRGPVRDCRVSLRWLMSCGGEACR